MVTNMENSLKFYMEGLGFELKIKWEPDGTIEWCWLELGNAALMLQEYHIDAPKEKLGIGISVCFMCEDALAIYKEIKSRGISTTTAPFVGNNLWVVSLKDPDGYNIFFEIKTDVKEGTISKM